MLNGAVSLGVLDLSPFSAFVFLDRGTAFGRGLCSLFCGGLGGAGARPLRVVRRVVSSSIVDLGVKGAKVPGCPYSFLKLTP